MEKTSNVRQFVLSARENVRSEKALNGKDVCVVKANGQKREPDDTVKSIFVRARCAEGL